MDTEQNSKIIFFQLDIWSESLGLLIKTQN